VIDLLSPNQKFTVFAEKVAIVFQIMDIDLKPAPANFSENALRNLVTLFRNEVKRRFDAIGVIKIHQSRTMLDPFGRLNIVCYHGAAGRTVGPEPNERHPANTLRPHRQSEHPFMDTLDRRVNGPRRKGALDAPPEIKRLEVTPNENGHRRPKQIVKIANELSRRRSTAGDSINIPFEAQILDQLGWVE